jgi:hypothetical protein
MKKFICMIICTIAAVISSSAVATETETETEKIPLTHGFLTFGEGLFCVYLDGELFETEVIHFGEDGLFILEDDLVYNDRPNEDVARVKKWRCPYCYHWSELGKRCGNKGCPKKSWEEVNSPFP